MLLKQTLSNLPFQLDKPTEKQTSEMHPLMESHISDSAIYEHKFQILLYSVSSCSELSRVI